MSSSIGKIENSYLLLPLEPREKEEKQEIPSHQEKSALEDKAQRYQEILLKHIQTPVSMEEFVKNFVAAFLHPYITGQITKETESKERKPMIEELFSELKKKFPEECTSKKEKIEAIAFDHYLFCAAQGLYVHCKKRGGEMITLENEEYNALLSALEEALPKDFPQKTVSQEKLKELAANTLRDFNMQRLRDRQEFLSETSAESNASDKHTKSQKTVNTPPPSPFSASSPLKKRPFEPLQEWFVYYFSNRLLPYSLKKISSIKVDEISSEIP